jgi:hypothetical protein
MTADPQINLLHLELLHHFEKETMPTLSLPEVWPKLLQQSFHVRQVRLPRAGAMLIASTEGARYVDDPMRRGNSSLHLVP